MTSPKRALLYLTRKKERSILLILIIFIMSSFIMVGAALKISADKEANKILKNLGSSFIIEPPIDNELYYEPAKPPLPASCNIYNGPKVTQDTVNHILNIEGVTRCFARYSYVPVYTSLELKPGAYAWSKEHQEYDGNLTKENVAILMHQTSLFMASEGELHKAFRTGALEITNGRNTQKEDYHTAVISEYFAEKNHLEVGNTLELYISYTTNELINRIEGEPVNLTIVGIFHTNIAQESSMLTLESSYTDNFIFADFDTGKEMSAMYEQAFCEDCGTEFKAEKFELPFEDITFFVDYPQKMDSIMQEIKESNYFEKGLLLTRDDTSYRASIAPLKTISILAMILLAVGSIGCMVILVLLLTMWIRGRKREIGILISVGISKGKIMLQMLIECLAVSAVGVILTILLSGATINSCCKIAEKITTPPENQIDYAIKFDSMWEPHFNKISADAVQLEYDYSIRDAILLIIAVCGISSGSVLAASRQIMKMEPQSLFQTL